jgi:uncharacterized repeat protein (TIGR03803 family)
MQRRRSLRPIFVLFGLAIFCASTAIASPAQTLTTLYKFCSQPNCADGYYPKAGLVQAADGNFYETTTSGGANICQNGCGTVLKITPGGSVTTLYSFCSRPNCTDGYGPDAGLVQGTDGDFYGTTEYGGDSGKGTVFKITPGGTFTTLHSFNGYPTDGAQPTAGLVQGTDGDFYGMAGYGGAYHSGIVFKMTPGGTLTTIYNFCAGGGYCVDGYGLDAGLVQGTDGDFYGTTEYGGGFNANGTVFKITPGGALTKLHTFYYTDGCYPDAGLVQGTDGSFYGTTLGCGASDDAGTAFKITSEGTLTTLYNFCSKPNCADGYGPEGGLLQAVDGNFYGTTWTGGPNECGFNGCGTVFKMTPSGTLTTVHSFDDTEGFYPYAGLVQTINGNFYGTTGYGGHYDGGSCYYGCGTLFTLSPGTWQFIPVTPCRLIDTRSGGGPIQGGTIETFNLPQLAQAKGCDNLSTAAAYSLNVTAVPQGPLGYLTIWPAGQSQPGISTLNSLDGRVKANAAIVPAGVSGGVNVSVSNTANVVLDIDGYFTPATQSTLTFYALPPCRVADTRDPNGPLGGPHLSGTVPRDFPVLESSCFPQGLNPAAYSFNFTVVPHVPLGYLTVWPAGQMQPEVSTLNAPTGTVVANAAIVQAGTGGDIDAVASNDTELVIDVNGYFAAPGGQNALSLYPVVPCRVLDTRNRHGAFVGELTVNVLDSGCGVPNPAQAYVFNATVVPSGPLGFLTLWADGGQQPLVSTLNAVDGAITSNMAIVPNTDGSTDAFASSVTQLILDISSYFAP